MSALREVAVDFWGLQECHYGMGIKEMGKRAFAFVLFISHVHTLLGCVWYLGILGSFTLLYLFPWLRQASRSARYKRPLRTLQRR